MEMFRKQTKYIKNEQKNHLKVHIYLVPNTY